MYMYMEEMYGYNIYIYIHLHKASPGDYTAFKLAGSLPCCIQFVQSPTPSLGRYNYIAVSPQLGTRVLRPASAKSSVISLLHADPISNQSILGKSWIQNATLSTKRNLVLLGEDTNARSGVSVQARWKPRDTNESCRPRDTAMVHRQATGTRRKFEKSSDLCWASLVTNKR